MSTKFHSAQSFSASSQSQSVSVMNANDERHSTIDPCLIPFTSHDISIHLTPFHSIQTCTKLVTRHFLHNARSSPAKIQNSNKSRKMTKYFQLIPNFHPTVHKWFSTLGGAIWTIYICFLALKVFYRSCIQLFSLLQHHLLVTNTY